ETNLTGKDNMETNTLDNNQQISTPQVLETFSKDTDTKKDVVANKSSNILNEKEISNETNLMGKDNMETNTLDNNQQIPTPQVLETFSKDTDTKKDVFVSAETDVSTNISTDISTSNTEEQFYIPIIQTEGRDIVDIWNDYKSLT